MLTVLTLVVLGQVDGGMPTWAAPDPEAVVTRKQLYGSCPDAQDAGPAIPIEIDEEGFVARVDHPDGGNDWLLPAPRAARVACLLATCMVRDDQLEPLTKFDGVTLFVLGAVAGVAIGASVAIGVSAAVNAAKK